VLFAPGELFMDIRPPRVMLTANVAVFLLVCTAFLRHYLGVGLYSRDMESWMENNQWLMWTAATLAVVSALAVPPLGLTVQQSGGNR
jgi:hypothetical protein